MTLGRGAAGFKDVDIDTLAYLTAYGVPDARLQMLLRKCQGGD